MLLLPVTKVTSNKRFNYICCSLRESSDFCYLKLKLQVKKFSYYLGCDFVVEYTNKQIHK